MPEMLTAHLGLPLPHPENELAEDVLRIRDAFTALDQKLEAIDLLLSSDDLTLDSLQELVTAIKQTRTEAGAVSALVAQQLADQNAAINSQLAAQNDAVTQQLAALSALVYAGL